MLFWQVTSIRNFRTFAVSEFKIRVRCSFLKTKMLFGSFRETMRGYNFVPCCKDCQAGAQACLLNNILAWEFVTRSCLKPQNPCSNHEIHVLFEHGFYLKKPKLGPDLHAWRYTGKSCGPNWPFRRCFPRKNVARIYMTLWRRNDVRMIDADAILFREIKCKGRDI